MTRAPGSLAASSAAAPIATMRSPSTRTATPSRGRSDAPSIPCAALISVGEAKAVEPARASRQAGANLHMAGMLAPRPAARMRFSRNRPARARRPTDRSLPAGERVDAGLSAHAVLLRGHAADPDRADDLAVEQQRDAALERRDAEAEHG